MCSGDGLNRKRKSLKPEDSRSGMAADSREFAPPERDGQAPEERMVADEPRGDGSDQSPKKGR